MNCQGEAKWKWGQGKTTKAFERGLEGLDGGSPSFTLCEPCDLNSQGYRSINHTNRERPRLAENQDRFKRGRSGFSLSEFERKIRSVWVYGD
jgi:hypothetical protein